MTAPLSFILAVDPTGTPYLAGIVAGFVLGAIGQLFSSRILVAIGIAVVLITTALFIIASDPTSGSY